MLKPKLMAGFSHWKGGWEEARHAKATMSLEQRLGAQVLALSKELEEAKAMLHEGRGNMSAADKAMEDKIAVEKERRIEHASQMALKRIMRRDLAVGWSAWLDMYLEKGKRVGLSKPATCFGYDAHLM